MEFGRIEYLLRNGSSGKKVLLTLIGQSDEFILKRDGLRALRLRRILRLTHEAEEQGHLLSYEDLSALLVTSVSTLKRDVAYLEKKGHRVPLKGRRKRRNPILLYLIFLFILLLPSLSEARYNLYGGVDLEYEKRWTNERSAYSITQGYQLGINGPVIDRRLLTFDIKGTLRDRSGTLYEDNLKGLDLRVTLFNFRYVRSRTLGFMNYMPRPITLRYSQYDGDFSKNTNYGFSTSWSVPFYINLFGHGKILRIRSIYEIPQRLKFNQQVINENQNAIGNVNQNNNEQQQIQKRPKEPFQGIRIPIPSINFDFDKNISELKDNNQKIENTLYNLRMRTGGRNSNYILDYYRNTTDYSNNIPDYSIERITLNTLHNFTSSRLDNRLTFEKFGRGENNTTNTTSFESRFGRYLQKDKDTSYRWNLTGTYKKTETETGYADSYGITGGWSVSKRLSPYLYSTSSLGGTYRQSRTADESSEAYSFNASQGFVSTYFRGIVLRGNAGVGYSEEGVPLDLSLGFNTTKWRRFSFSGSYSYNRFISSDETKTYESYSIFYGASAFLMKNLSSQTTFRHTIRNIKNNPSYREISDRLDTTLNWFYRRHRLTIGGFIERVDTTDPDITNKTSEVYSARAIYSVRLSNRTNLISSYTYDRSNTTDTTNTEFKNSLSWYYGRLVFSGEYALRTVTRNDTSTEEHRLYLKLSRYFGRR